jgi:hypothetical protein
VLVAVSAEGIRVLDSRRVQLSDPEVPDSKQPYHDGFATPRTGASLKKLVGIVERYGDKSVRALLRDYATHGKIRAAGLVVGSLIDPDTLGNEHIRIHAHEGRLFRTVIHDAVVAAGLKCGIVRERDLNLAAAKTIGLPIARIKKAVAKAGAEIDGPWRAEQKLAAIAAWMQAGKR